MQTGEKLSSSSSAVTSSSQTTAGATASAGAGKPVTSSGGAQPRESKEVVLSRLMKLEAKDLMKEIISGHVPLSLLNQVAGRLPAEMLQEAVDFLSNSDNGNAGQIHWPSNTVCRPSVALSLSLYYQSTLSRHRLLFIPSMPTVAIQVQL